ncbi:MAG TPA: (Fe-S)-binding protein [Methyloceanibacter sp.]|nr:(Fe-S)-binding protein [Methyloceanibacter sp.]
MTTESAEKRPHVGLFVTCLVDLFRPSVGFAAIKLLEEAGAAVEVPESQTCCGQPAYNSGDRADAKAIARAVIESFERFDYAVTPSGSCAGMLKVHYPSLFADDPLFAERARALGAKSYELTSFLVEILRADKIAARFDGSVTYHDSCSCLRELKVRDAPRRLLKSVDGLSLTEMEETEVCCGFGGAFSVKYPEISSAIDEAKARNIAKSGASCLLAADLGCLLHIAGGLSRDGSKVECRHVAEVLAGMTEGPAIGQARKAG